MKRLVQAIVTAFFQRIYHVPLSCHLQKTLLHLHDCYDGHCPFFSYAGGWCLAYLAAAFEWMIPCTAYYSMEEPCQLRLLCPLDDPQFQKLLHSGKTELKLHHSIAFSLPDQCVEQCRCEIF